MQIDLLCAWCYPLRCIFFFVVVPMVFVPKRSTVPHLIAALLLVHFILVYSISHRIMPFFRVFIFVSYFIYRISHVCTVYTVDYVLSSICNFFWCVIPLIREVLLHYFFFFVRYYSINALNFSLCRNYSEDTLPMCLNFFHNILLVLCIRTGRLLKFLTRLCAVLLLFAWLLCCIETEDDSFAHNCKQKRRQSF